MSKAAEEELAKKGRSIVACSLASITLISGCASSSRDIASAYVSPNTYQSWSCEQIYEENSRLAVRVSQLGGKVDERANGDAAAMTIGMILFWPALFFVKGNGPEAQEYARLKGEHEALQKAVSTKGCIPASTGATPQTTNGPAKLTPAVAVAAASPQVGSTTSRPTVEPIQNQDIPEIHCPKKGTTLITSKKGPFEFSDSNGLFCRYNFNGGIEERMPIMQTYSKNHRYAQEAQETIKKLSPLVVGETASFVSYSQDFVSSASWQHTFTVEGREVVSVPAGNFDTYVIRWKERSTGFERDTVYWYSPSIGLPVKQEITHYRGNAGGIESWEALEIKSPS